MSVFSDGLWLARQGLVVLREEGVRGLGPWIVLRMVGLARLLWFSQTYAVHVTSTCAHEAGMSQHRIDGLEVHFLTEMADAERLLGHGYQDVRHVVRAACRRLRSGAVCMCLFIDREVAHVEWLALTEDVRRAVFPAPCFVKYECREAAWGGAHTPPKYRNRGVFRYGMACALRYCHEQGYKALVGVTAVGNEPSLQGQTPFAPRIRALLRYRCFLASRRWTLAPHQPCGKWLVEDGSPYLNRQAHLSASE